MRSVVAPRSAPSRRWLVWLPAAGTGAVAALLLVVALGPASEPWARSLELSRARVWLLPDGLAEDARSAVERQRFTPPIFEVPASGTRQERRAAGRESPSTILPRWEATDTLTPTFRWTAGSDDARYEVLLLDAARRLVWTAEARGESLEYPTAQAPLRPGQTYYWKVNSLGGERVLASSYTAFLTLDAAGQEQLASDLRAAGDHPFLIGTAYDRHGLYTQSVAAFERASGDLGRTARDAVRAKQYPDE